MRRSFSVGVTSSSSMLNSRGRTRNRLICSKPDRSVFTASTAACTAARTASSFSPSTAPGSTVTSAATYGLRSPTTTRLRHDRVRLQVVLEVLGSDVLAAGRHDDVLLAVRDHEEAVVVDVPDVAGVHEALVVEDLTRRRVVVVVAGEDRVRADQDLAVRRRCEARRRAGACRPCRTGSRSAG